MILVIHAHPYPRHSRAVRALLEAIALLPVVEVRSLYDLYPDFDIDVAAEQDALARCQLVVWLHPLHWYSVPGLLKQWFDKVLERGWAYGGEGRALAGKHCLWAPTVGNDEDTFENEGANLRPFARYVDPIEQTARYCAMEWEAPFVVFGTLTMSDEQLATAGTHLRERLETFARDRTRPAAGSMAQVRG